MSSKSGLTPLSFNWYQGARMLVTQKPVSKPSDLNGVRVRALEAPVTIETIKCMGGSPTPLSGLKSILQFRPGSWMPLRLSRLRFTVQSCMKLLST